MKILLILLALLPSLCLAEEATYHDYKFTIPERYKIFIADDDLVTKERVYIVNNDKKALLVIKKMDKNNKRSFPLDEYGANSHRELFYEFFSDKPTKNEAVLDIRKINKTYGFQEYKVTKNNGFVFFRTDNSMDSLNTTVFLVSTPINDEVLHLVFTNRANKEFIESIIDSLEVK